MLDFRYHALSLVAVFLALAIGIVLGVTIGDSLLADAERSLRSNLTSDVVDARNAEAQARAELAGRDRMLEQIYPPFVSGRLSGERVAVVAWGTLPDNVESGVRDAIAKAGGRIDSLSVLDRPLSDLRRVLGPSRYALDTADEEALGDLGRTLARSILSGGALADSLQREFPDEFGGRYERADAVVFYEAPRPDDGDDAGARERRSERARAVEGAMVDELRKRTIAVVGVETSDAERSQVSRYKSLEISSADSVDQAGGRMALVFALAGAGGSFGLEPSAEKPLPDEALSP